MKPIALSAVEAVAARLGPGSEATKVLSLYREKAAKRPVQIYEMGGGMVVGDPLTADELAALTSKGLET